jgi:hypothetical protein
MTYFKRLIWAVTVVLLTVAPIQADNLNVFTDDDNADIFLNEEHVGTGSLRDHFLDSGTYLLEVFIDDTMVYSKVISMEKDKVQTIRTFDYSQKRSRLDRRKIQKREDVEYLTFDKGAIGIGFNVGVLSGLSVRYFPIGNIGLQTTGWYSSSTGYTSKKLELRGLYYFGNQIFFDTPFSGYAFAGYGKKSSTTEAITGLDVGLGIEFSMKPVATAMGLATLTDNSDDTDFFQKMGFMVGLALSYMGYPSIEIGYGMYENSVLGDYKGIVGRFGFHYYF